MKNNVLRINIVIDIIIVEYIQDTETKNAVNDFKNDILKRFKSHMKL